MSDRVTASLYGLVSPVGQDAGFVIPLFSDPTGGNSLLAQRVGNGDRIRNFEPVQPPSSTMLVREDKTRRPGQSALWAFQFGDGTYAVDTRAALTRILSDVKGDYRDQPFLFLQIVQFCELASETASALKAAYAYLAAHSRQSAEAWRDIVFLPTLGRSILESMLTPRPKSNVLGDVKFIVDGGGMTIMLPKPVYNQLQGRAGLAAKYRKVVLDKARGLDIKGIKLDRLERAATGLTPRNPETVNRTIVFPVGTSGARLIQAIGKLPPTRSRRPNQRTDPNPIQTGPATSKLRGVRIGRVVHTLGDRPKIRVKRTISVIAGAEPLAILVFGGNELSNLDSLTTAKALASAYRQAGARVIALQSVPQQEVIPPSDENFSKAISLLRRYLDYWVFVRPQRSNARGSISLEGNAQQATYAAVDIIHTCATTNMRDELWRSNERERMRFAASAYMRSSLDDDIGTTCRKLVEQMMGSISVEHADTLIALFERPRPSGDRFQDSFTSLPASFAGSLRFSSMDRPMPRPKSKRASAPSTALLLGVQDFSPPSKFEATCAQILEKNGFKILRSPKKRGDITASFEGQDFEIECLWSDVPPRGFDRDRLKPSFHQKAIISNWPVPNDLALRYALDDVLCVSTINIPWLTSTARRPGSFLMHLFTQMPLKEFRETLQANIGGFLSREFWGNPDRYSLFQDLAGLSSNTQIESTTDEIITLIKVEAGEVVIEGTMTVEVELNYGKEPDDHTSDSYPGKFFLKLTAAGLNIDDAEVDTSSFYE